jgi:hypothetical protein
MRVPAGEDRGRPVLRDTRHAMVEFWQALCPARPQDEAERWPASVSPDSFPTRFGARVGGCQENACGHGGSHAIPGDGVAC